MPRKRLQGPDSLMRSLMLGFEKYLSYPEQEAYFERAITEIAALKESERSKFIRKYGNLRSVVLAFAAVAWAEDVRQIPSGIAASQLALVH